MVENISTRKNASRERAARMRTALQERLEALRWESRERLATLRAAIEERRAGLVRGDSSTVTGSTFISASTGISVPKKTDFAPLRDPGATLAPPVVAPPRTAVTPESAAAPPVNVPPVEIPAGPAETSHAEGTLYSAGPPAPPPVEAEPAGEENPVGEFVAEMLDRIGGDRLELTDEERRVVRKRLYKWIKSTTPEKVEETLAEVLMSRTVPPLLKERLIQAAADQVHPAIVKATKIALMNNKFRRALGKTRIGKLIPTVMNLIATDR